MAGDYSARSLGLSLIGILTLFVRGEPIYLNIVLAVVGLLTIVLITHLVVDRGSRLSSLLSWPPLVGIGQVSYGLYLWHWIWLQYPIWTEAVRLPVAVALTSAAVLASYYLVERPALRLKHRFQRTGDSRPVSIAAGANASVSRRDLLPVLGMSSLAVAAVAAYALAGRLYPKDTLAGSAPEPEAPAPLAATPAPELAASTVTPAPTLVATPAATRVPRPTRIPRASRAATPRASRARPEDNVPGQPTATARPDRARTRTAGKD